MATHSRILAWRIPGTGEPGGLPSMGSHRGGHDLSDLAAAGRNFKRWKWQSYMQDSERGTNVKNRLLDYVGEGKDGTICESNIETCILPYVK